jgi:hypothetical protein
MMMMMMMMMMVVVMTTTTSFQTHLLVEEMDTAQLLFFLA